MTSIRGPFNFRGVKAQSLNGRAYGRFDAPKELAMIRKFLTDESGATAIEYGLIAAGIAVAIIAAVQGLGTKLTSTFTAVEGALK